jgi:hypothetical protein
MNIRIELVSYFKIQVLENHPRYQVFIYSYEANSQTIDCHKLQNNWFSLMVHNDQVIKFLEYILFLQNGIFLNYDLKF